MELENIRINYKNLVELLYQYDFYDNNINFLNNYLVQDEDDIKVFNKIIENFDDINEIIEDNLFNYSLYRLNMVDRAIIRLAVFLIKFSQIPNPIIINNAIILTKDLSDLDDEKQHKFTNRLLDNISKGEWLDAEQTSING